MHQFITRIGLLLLCCASITSCSYFQKNDSDKTAYCREMKYNLLFNGATGNQQKAMQQRAEARTLNKSYRATGCQ